MESKVRWWKSRAILAALALAPLAFLATGFGRETERLFAEAAKAEGRDDYEGAARRLREIVIAHPQSPLAPRAQLELAEIYLLRMRDVGAAIAALVKILDDYPGSPVVLEAHQLLARIYQRDQGEPEKALHHYRILLDSPIDVDTEREVLLAMGECYYRLELMEDAAAAYRAAVELPPREGATDSALLRLATLSRLSGRLDESLRWLQEIRSVTDDPLRLHAALSAQVEVLLDLGRFEEADEVLREAERLAPDAPENAGLEARLHAARGPEAEAGEGNEALEELEKRIHWGSGRRARRAR